MPHTSVHITAHAGDVVCPVAFHIGTPVSMSAREPPGDRPWGVRWARAHATMHASVDLDRVGGLLCPTTLAYYTWGCACL
jgi:hypothetical protein